MSNKIENVLICQDCAMYICNGELPADTTPEQDQDIEHGATFLDIKYRFSSVGNAVGFKTGSCECCGSRLAGERWELDNLGLK